MKAKELLKMLNEASDTAEVKVIDGELVITEPKPIKYKFKVGDKVVVDNKTYKITDAIAQCGKLAYRLEGLVGIVYEGQINGYAPKPITERIKTFMDAFNWCNENGKGILTKQYDQSFHLVHENQTATDIIAYLKLRIITAALNEGWEPTFAEDELRYYCICDADGGALRVVSATKIGYITPYTLYFKTRELALYAATQFADIYTDFCGCKKGGAE